MLLGLSKKGLIPEEIIAIFKAQFLEKTEVVI